MAHYNYIVSGAHLVVMTLMTLGAKGLVRADGASRVLARGAVIGLASTCAAIAGMFVFPWGFGWGPWPYDSLPVSIIRLLVLLPGTLRPVAVALVVLAFTAASPPPRPRWDTLRNGGIHLLLAIDLALAVYKWLTTPKAVIALAHPFQPRPVLMIPWIAAMVLFLIAIRQDLFPRAPEQDAGPTDS